MNAITRRCGALLAAVAALLAAGASAGVALAETAQPAAHGIMLDAAEGTTLENHAFDAYLLGTYQDATPKDGATVDSVTVTATGDDVNTWVQAALSANSVDVSAPYDAVGTLARLSTTADAAKLRAIAQSLASSGSKPAPASSVQGSGDSMTLDVADGWYLVTDSNGLPMLVGTKIDGKDLTGQTLGYAMVKSKSIPLVKQVRDENTLEYVDDGDTTVTGATREYRLTFTMPTAGTASKLTLSDVMDGQTWTGADDFSVLYQPDADVDSFELIDGVKPTATATGWTVDLSDYLEEYAGEQLVIRYSATVNADDADNTATLHVEWADGSEPTDVTDRTSLHAYGIALLKTGLDSDDPLEGAGFKIAADIDYEFAVAPNSLDESDAKWLVRDGDHWATNADGQLLVTSYDEATELTTDGDGHVTFTGLPEGDYTIRESTVPDGHASMYAPTFDVHVAADGTVTVTGKGMFDNLVSDPDDSGVITVRNAESMFQMPETGAAGVGVTVMLGGLLLALAALPWLRARMLARRS